MGEEGRDPVIVAVFLKKDPDHALRPPVRDGGLRRWCACSVAAMMTAPHRAQETLSLLGLTPAIVVGPEYIVVSEKRAETGMGSIVSCPL